MNNQSRLGHDEYNYKANKHLERAASLLEQHGANDLSGSQAYSFGWWFADRKEAKKKRKASLHADLRNQGWNDGVIAEQTRLNEQLELRRKEETRLGDVVANLQEENKKLNTEIKRLNNERDNERIAFEKKVKQEHDTMFEEKQKPLQVEVKKFKDALQKIADTQKSTELYTIKRIKNNSPDEKALTPWDARGKRFKSRITITTMMNPKEVKLGEMPVDMHRDGEMDDNIAKKLQNCIKESTGKEVDWSKLQKALPSDGSVFLLQ